MIGVTFAPGSEVWVHGRAAKIVAAADLRSASVEFIPSGERQTLDLAALYAEGVLRWTPPEPEAALAEHGLERITEARWEEARRREAIVKEAFDGPVAFARVKEVATRSEVCWRTLYRWRAEYGLRGLRGLVPDYERRGGVGRGRLDEARETLLQETLRKVYLQRTRPTQRHTYEQTVAIFRGRDLAPPSLNTVVARIHALDAATELRTREGGARSRDRHMVSRGRFPATSGPLGTILIDHTPLDLHLVDTHDRSRVIGRPFLTLAMDAFTRMVFGYFLTLDPPSYLSVAMCLLQGVLMKDEVLRRFDLKERWPIYGLPHTVHTDNGKDFLAKHLDRLAEQYAIELQRRPVRTPHYGALIERVIGTVNNYTHALPGTAKSSVKERGGYDAEKAATFTLEEAERFIARRIVEHYHVRPHSELGKSPLAAWDEAVRDGKFVPSLPADPECFRIDVLPYEERTIQKEGIALFGLTYADGVLRSWRGRERRGGKETKYVVKYDPRDLSRVYFIPPDGTAPRAIPLLDRATGPFSMLELRRSQALAKVNREPWPPRNVWEMLQRERAALDEAAEKTKLAKRTAARVQRQHATATGATGATAETATETSTAPPPALRSKRVEEEPLLTPLRPLASTDDDGWGTPVLHYGRE